MATAMTAPKRAPSTAPPATMLSRKFFNDGANSAALATSGVIMEAVRAAAVSPVTAFSLSEAWTLTARALGLWPITAALWGLMSSGLKKVVLVLESVSGVVIEIDDREAISFFDAK